MRLGRQYGSFSKNGRQVIHLKNKTSPTYHYSPQIDEVNKRSFVELVSLSLY